MNLYEITNGFMGESYVRLYAWARDEDHARQLAVISFATHEGRYGAAYYEDLQIEKLLSGDEQPFATKPSDAGWERAQAYRRAAKMARNDLIGKRVENEHGRIGTIISVSHQGQFAHVSFPDGYEGRDDEGACVLTMRVEDLEPVEVD